MLLEPCRMPQWQGKTNGDLVDYIAELKTALAVCSADKKAIAKIVGQKNKERQ